MSEESKKFLGLSKKEWMLFIIPVLLNGFFIFGFQLFLNEWFEDKNREEELQYTIYQEFWDKTKNFNDVLNQTNIQTQKDGNLYGAINSIGNEMIELELYYDTNAYDLKVFENSYRNFTSSWEEFLDVLDLAEDGITTEDAEKLGDSLEQVKADNLELIKTIREEMKAK